MEKQTLTRKELYDLVWSKSLSALAKEFLISDNGLRKICNRMEIPMPNMGHWNKVQYNRKVVIKKLPMDYTGNNTVDLFYRKEGDYRILGLPSPFITLEKEIIEKEGDLLIVPEKLTKPCELIVLAKDNLTQKKGSYMHGGLLNTSSDLLNITVSKDSIFRALRFMDTFIKVIEKRGHEIKIRHDTTYIVIQGEEIKLSLREKLKRIEKESKWSWKEYDFLPTGILVLNAYSYPYNHEWKDGQVTIENQLPKIIAKLEISGEKLKIETIEREKRHAIEEEKERIRKEWQKRKDKELENFKKLLKYFKQWQEAENLRKYLTEVETNARNNNKFTNELNEWLIWARKKSDWYDPLISLPDEYLNDEDKESIINEKKPQNSFQYWR